MANPADEKPKPRCCFHCKQMVVTGTDHFPQGMKAGVGYCNVYTTAQIVEAQWMAASIRTRD